MTTIIEQAQQAELALAAYADLAKGIPDRNSLIAAGFSESQADQFREKYTVVDQHNVTSGDGAGLSVTVFEDKITHARYLAVRGTNDLPDFATDLIDIAVLGTPFFQGQYESLKEKVQIWLGDGTLPSTFTVTGHSLGGFLSTALTADFGNHIKHTYLYNSPGLNGILGGATQPILNALGITAPIDITKISNIKAEAGISPITGLGAQVTTPIWIQIENQFNSDVANPPDARNHSQQVLNDALALHATFAQIAPSFTVVQLSNIFKSASNQNKLTLESTLDSLRIALLGKDAVDDAPTLEGNRESFYQKMYELKNSAAFQSFGGTIQIVPLASLSAANLATTAKTDFGTLLSLQFGLPFVLKGTVLGNHWQSTYPDLYAQWQTDQNLPAQDDKGVRNFSDHWLTDRAMLLRADLQANIRDFNYRSNVNPLYVKGIGSNPIDFIIRGATSAEDYVVKTLPEGVSPQNRGEKYLIGFGSDGDDKGERALTGAGGNDRFYGGDGNDELNGGQGNDYLEGNSGNDKILGGDGKDEILGGDNDDELTGNKENDILKGGAGNDTYKFFSGDGWDTVIDSDGQGSVTYDGIVLTGGLYVAPNVWQKKDTASGQTFTYSLYDQTVNGQTFQVLSIQGAGGGLHIKGWQEGQLGISLPSAPPPTQIPVGGPNLEIKKTTWYDQDHTVADGRGLGEQTFEAVGDFGEVYGQGKLVGNDSANYLHNGEGDDELYGMGGQDTLIATTGNDKLFGGADNDALSGGADNDLLDGGNGSDVLSGGSGSDVLVGGEGVDYLFGGGDYEAFRADWSVTPAGSDHQIQFNHFSGGTYLEDDGSDLLRGGRGDDHLWGGVGDDQLYGEEDNDQLVGDTGKDFLSGGIGNDKLFGDGSQSSNPDRYTYPEYHGDDVLDGGEGDDTLYGDGGTDELHGGIGNDILVGDFDGIPIEYHGEDYLDGGDGNDTLFGYGKGDTLFGGNGDDILEGDSNSVAHADHGDDYLDGEDGNDKLQGDGGNDTLFGGIGNDRLFGDADDVAVANQGDDYLDGEEGDDYLRGYGGNDQLMGGAGVDQLLGEEGDDYLDGGDGDDILDGGEGKDMLAGGTGTDTLRGGEGDDVYMFELGDGPEAADQSIETIYETGGKDIVRFGAGIALGGLQIFAANGSVLLIQYGNDQLAISDGLAGAVEAFEFSDGQRVSYAELIGRLSATPILGQDADGGEFQLGGYGDDILTITQGHATLSGGRGNDLLQGNGGNNTYLYGLGEGTDRIIDISAKTDAQGNPMFNRLRFGPGITQADIRLGLDSLKIMVGSNPSDAIHIEGFNADDALGMHSAPAIDFFEFDDGTVLTYAELLQKGFDHIGSDSDDTITGTSVSDRINGGAGNDLLKGGGGSDTYLWGQGSGQDVIDNVDTSTGKVDTLRIASGLTVADLSFVRSGNNLVVRVRNSSDQVTVQNHFDGAAIDRIEFGDGIVWEQANIDANVSNELTNGSDTYTGTVGNDSINALGGDDVVNGMAGDDTINGGDGADNLYGNDGNDTLDGGAGSDILYGGVGGDTYIFGRGSGADRIVDNGDVSSIDVIRLRPDILPSDVKLGRSNNDLVIRIVGTSDQMTVWGAFMGGATGAASRIERIEFADMTTWTETEIRQRILIDSATSGNDSITGFDGNDVVHALDGNDTVFGGAGNDFLQGGSGVDTLYGENGNDVLDGGVGNDTLYGGAGSDVILFGRASGWDTLYCDDSSSAVDAVQFDDDIAPADIKLSHLGDDLYITIGSSRLYIPGYFSWGGINAIDELRFKDGTVWRYPDVKEKLLTATEGVDSLVGFSGDDVMNGLGGNDYLDGAGGHDQLSGGLGDDRLYGGAGNDILTGGDGADRLDGGDAKDTLHGGAGNDILSGGAGDDIYRFGRGDSYDSINETSQTDGFDVLELGTGIAAADITLYRDGNDLIVVVDGSSTQISVRNYFSDPNARIERIRFVDGVEWDTAVIEAKVITGTPNAMTGTVSNDTFVVDHVQDTITEGVGQGIDTVQSSLTWTIGENIENLTLTGVLHISGTGNAMDNVLLGNASENTLSGMDGSDTLYGGAGNDGLYGGAGMDYLYGGAGNDTYWDYSQPDGDTIVEAAGEGIDTIMSAYGAVMPDNVENYVITSWSASYDDVTGNVLDNVITGNDEGNVLDGGQGADTLIGKYGDDVYVVDSTADQVIENNGQGTDTVRSFITYTLAANIENLELLGNAASNGIGNELHNVMNGSEFLNPSAPVFEGYTGNSAANILFGGRGNDVYYLGEGDKAVENAEEGIDTVHIRYTPTGNFSLNNPEFLNIENLIIRYVGGDWNIEGSIANNSLTGGSGNNQISGGVGNDQLYGLEGHDFLDGGTGADVMDGGLGNDIFIVDNVGDQVYEAATYAGYYGGQDTVRSSISYTLTDNIEDLVLTGNEAIQGNGNGLGNILDGSQNAAANVLVGGGGNDVYILGEGDTIIEVANDGIDTVHSSVTYGLTDNLENLILTGSANTNGSGNSADNVLTGNGGANTLEGGTGNDTLSGGNGNDTYVFNLGDGHDAINNGSEDGATATDVITLGSGITIENVLLKRVGNNLILTIDAGNSITINGHFLAEYAMDRIVFADGTVWGQDEIIQRTAPVPTSGADTLYGFNGNDIIHGLEGDDDIFGDAGDDHLFGDEGIDVLFGQDGNDLLDGGAGIDEMLGGIGNDIYIVDNVSDTVIEDAGEGSDTVQSSITYTLGNNVENLTLTGTSAINATGNSLDNILAGNVGANILKGGAGNDVYYVGTGDTVTENTGAGTDTIVSDITWTLGSNLENLTLTGSAAVNGIGNALANVIIGNDAGNTLNGAGGADHMSGGAGNDTYVVDNAGDTVVEQADEGIDLLQSTITYTLTNNVENLTLTGTAAIHGTGNSMDNVLIGNSGANTLTGAEGNDTLNGGAGADKMIGGGGNDGYVIDNIGDVITENSNEGIDSVQSSITYTLGANVENLTLTGTTAINGTGNVLDNVLVGNGAINTLNGGAGNDMLNGGVGADKLNGGTGNDTYVVDNTGDVVTENANEGIDWVQSSVAYTLTTNVEALTLTGTTTINGTGNASDNLLIGNGANNTLNGAAGTDLLQGAAGTDTLSDTAGNNLFDGGAGGDTITGGVGNEFFVGGAGNDTITTSTGTDVIAFNLGDGQDVVNASTGKDNTLSLGKGITYADLLFKKNANDLILVTGAAEQITFKDWYASANNRSVATLQVTIEGTTDYGPSSASQINDNKVEQFNFDGLAAKFDQALAATPGLTSWSLSSSLLEFHLSGSDTAAIGGDLAYQYAKNGNLSNLSMTPAQALLASPQFGTANQSLQATTALQDSSPRLM